MTSAAHVFDFREIADYVVEHEDTATAANALRNAQDEIDRLRAALERISRQSYRQRQQRDPAAIAREALA
jgi:plasmid stabilization system protein ParE